MGDYTQAEMSRIDHKLQSSRLAQRKTELAFLAIFLVVMAGLGGYILGCFYPYRPHAPEWAEKIGTARVPAADPETAKRAARSRK